MVKGRLVQTTTIVIIVFAVVVIYFWKKETDYYTVSNPIIIKIKENFAKLNPQFYNIPIKEGPKPETENKSKITMCVKNPKTGQYYDMNSIMYVALHELTHVLSKDSQDHDAIFERNFTKILDDASRVGIYNPNIPVPLIYCGIGPE